jgi:fatty acid synthase subunit alpha, fungi type
MTQLYSLSGSDLRLQTSSLTRSVCDQIFTKALHWPKATNLPEGTTRAVGFGAGGISGIGPLTARNLDGHGVHVIVIGEKGKGDAEFYSVCGVRKELSWIKKWAPSLVKTR